MDKVWPQGTSPADPTHRRITQAGRDLYMRLPWVWPKDIRAPLKDFDHQVISCYYI